MTIPEIDDPLVLFHDWLNEAEAKDETDHTAACLATAGINAIPSARMVLLKGADPNGFVFYTNLDSRKGQEITENPNAALCFYWKSLRRQVRVEGSIASVPASTADTYFATRPREAQIGAWASLQSRTLEARSDLERRVKEYSTKFGPDPVPRPNYWSGYCLIPRRIEFWKNANFRLHDRLIYTLSDGTWKRSWLFP